MAYDHAAVLRAQHDDLQARKLAAANDYEAARLREDPDDTMEAANRYLDVEQKLAALDAVATRYVHGAQQAQTQQQHNPHGLTADELEVAKISGISGEQYAQNKQRMQQMKNEGYWSQGRVFK